MELGPPNHTIHGFQPGTIRKAAEDMKDQAYTKTLEKKTLSLSLCLSLSLSLLYIYIYVYMYMYVGISVYPSIHPSVHTSIHPFILPSMHLSICSVLDAQGMTGTPGQGSRLRDLPPRPLGISGRAGASRSPSSLSHHAGFPLKMVLGFLLG